MIDMIKLFENNNSTEGKIIIKLTDSTFPMGKELQYLYETIKEDGKILFGMEIIFPKSELSTIKTLLDDIIEKPEAGMTYEDEIGNDITKQVVSAAKKLLNKL